MERLMRYSGTHLNQKGSRQNDTTASWEKPLFFGNVYVKGLKHDLRRRIRDKRLHVPIGLQRYFANRITIQLLQSRDFKQSQSIAFYSAAFGEVSTALALKYALAHHKACYLPVLKKDRLIFLKVTQSTQFVSNRFGIAEPPFEERNIIAPEALDLVIMPLVAFDSKCHRLGMGGGFYDKTFSFKRTHSMTPKLIGLAYEFQRVERVPKSNLDVLLDSVITEKKRYHT
jgi:5-formyltetrahydrofolate cyclo-ligase